MRGHSAVPRPSKVFSIIFHLEGKNITQVFTAVFYQFSVTFVLYLLPKRECASLHRLYLCTINSWAYNIMAGMRCVMCGKIVK